MYRFLITEITNYGETGSCVAGFLFSIQNGITQHVGRKRLYLISEKSGRSVYPPRGKFERGILTFLTFESGILINTNYEQDEYYPREERKEDISVGFKNLQSVVLSDDFRSFFQNIDIPEFNLNEYFPQFTVRNSKKIFTPNKLNFNTCDSLFYFEFSKDDIFFTEDYGECFLNFNNSNQIIKIKIISEKNNLSFYEEQFSNNPSKIIACIGISQYYDCRDAPENSGYYLLCNEIYFM